jgi:hypothetical protein
MTGQDPVLKYESVLVWCQRRLRRVSMMATEMRSVSRPATVWDKFALHHTHETIPTNGRIVGSPSSFLVSLMIASISGPARPVIKLLSRPGQCMQGSNSHHQVCRIRFDLTIYLANQPLRCYSMLTITQTCGLRYLYSYTSVVLDVRTAVLSPDRQGVSSGPLFSVAKMKNKIVPN